MKGFIQIPILLIAVVVGIAVLGGGGYVAYKQTQKPTSESTPRNENIDALLEYAGELDATTKARVEAEGKTAEYSEPEKPPAKIDGSLDAQLESSVFITPGGTQTLRPPKGWTPSVQENEYYIQVSFEGKGQGGISFNIIPNGTDGKRYTLEEYVAGEVDAPPFQKMIKKVRTTVAGVDGYLTEKTQTVRTGATHMKVYTFLKNGKFYQIAGGSLEADWAKYEALIDASLSTMQIP